MVVKDFLDYINQFKFVHSGGLYDIFDRCVYILTFSIVLVCSATVTVKSYILDPMVCYLPTSIGGSNVLPYVNNYCWIIGTVAKSVHEPSPDNKSLWSSVETRRINYYQWVPLMLGLLAALIYMPYVIWECMVYNRLGTNLQYLMTLARKASLDYGASRKKKLYQMAKRIFELLYARKKKNNKRSQCSSKFEFYKMEIVFYYLLLKFTSIVILFIQLIIMEKFFNMGERYRFLGVSVLRNLLGGNYWMSTHLFPRMAFCRVPFKIQNNIVDIQAQCSLSINLLNEKVFIFLWWWFCLVVSLQIFGFMLWIYRCLLPRNRTNFIEYNMVINNSFSEHYKSIIKSFDQNLLSIDGSFLIRMTRLNCGDLICKELIEELVNIYLANDISKYQDSTNERLTATTDDIGKEFDKTAFL